MLAALAMIVAVIGVIGASESRAGAPGDTIAVVDGSGHFTILSEIAKGANTRTITFGRGGDVPLMGDWDCDGEETPGVYRLSTGGVYLRNSNTTGVADRAYFFGNPGDRAIAGDFNGDGCDTVSVYRSHRATVYMSNALDFGMAEFDFLFGNPGDRSFTGDFNGDGVETIGLHRNSLGRSFISNQPSGGAATPVSFGNPNDVIIAGDWDGDGSDTLGAYRPSTGMFYYRNSNSSGAADGSLFVGRGVTVVAVAGAEGASFNGPGFDPGPATPPPTTTAPPTPAPAPSPPSSGGGDPVPVPGFSTPPARSAVGSIDINGQSNVVIENVHVSNPGGTCIDVTNSSNVVIRNVTFGPCGGNAVYLSDVDGATVSGNYINGTANGVLVHRSDSIKVDGNAFINAGRNFVQFDKVNGAGSSISGNRGQNEIGGSNAEDFISLYKSNGTSSSPIRIVGNHLRSGGPSNSGSGIMLGDGGGSYQYVANNVLVDPGQVGIGVASGTDITVTGNRVYSARYSWSNVGIYVWNQYGTSCNNITVSNNQVNWTAAGGYSNPWWAGGGCGTISEHHNDWRADIGPEMF